MLSRNNNFIVQRFSYLYQKYYLTDFALLFIIVHFHIIPSVITPPYINQSNITHLEPITDTKLLFSNNVIIK